METNTTNALKNKKRIIGISIGTLSLGVLTFFGIKLFKKSKNKIEDETNDTSIENDIDTSNKSSDHTKPHTNLPNPNVSTSFPLHLGSKGDQVRQLQNALIKRYGISVLPKYGADGQFGLELDTALRSKGYRLPIDVGSFSEITGTTKPITTNPLSFNPVSIAKGIYASIQLKDFNSCLTLLKGIKSTTNYSLVSEQLKTFLINGVHQTLVNAILNSFQEEAQRIKIQDAFKSMGLKYNGRIWII